MPHRRPRPPCRVPEPVDRCRRSSGPMARPSMAAKLFEIAPIPDPGPGEPPRYHLHRHTSRELRLNRSGEIVPPQGRNDDTGLARTWARPDALPPRSRKVAWQADLRHPIAAKPHDGRPLSAPFHSLVKKSFHSRYLGATRTPPSFSGWTADLCPPARNRVISRTCRSVDRSGLHRFRSED